MEGFYTSVEERTRLRDFPKSHAAPEPGSLTVVSNQPWP